METSRRQLCALLSAYSLLAAIPALADSIPPEDYRVPAEIAGYACGVSDPTDPHQILGPNPAHADCLTALYPSVLPGGSFAADPGPTSTSTSSTASASTPFGATTLWLLVTALAMMALAGFNSRKRHRRLPMPGLDGSSTLETPRDNLHTHTEGSRWHDD